MGKFLPQPADLFPLLPGVGVAGLLLLFGLWLLKKGRTRTATVSISLALPVAYGWAFKNLNDWPNYPAIDSTDRGFYLVCAVALGALSIEIGASLMATRPFYNAILERLFRSAALFSVLWAGISYQLRNFVALDPSSEAFVSSSELAALAALFTGFSFLIQEVMRRLPALPICGVLAMIMGAVGQAFVMRGAAPYLGQFLGAGSLLMLIAAALTPLWENRRLPLVLGPILTGVIAATGLDALYYALETPSRTSLIVLLVSPALMLPAGVRKIRELGGWKTLAISTLPAIAVVVLGFFMAIDKPEATVEETDSAPNPYEDLDFLPK